LARVGVDEQSNASLQDGDLELLELPGERMALRK